jgi:pimeloyl-ACP methyl ester carboxylesterase
MDKPWSLQASGTLNTKYMQEVILLHGALGCKAHWDHILPFLDKTFSIHNLDFPGHGGSTASNAELTLEELSSFVMDYVSSTQLKRFSIMGYSMGGYVGLDLAIKKMPGLAKVVTLGTKLNWDPEIAEAEISKLSIENLAPIHSKLEQEHGSNWRDVISATHSIMRSIGMKPLRSQQLNELGTPVTLLLGEKDRMVTKDETELFCSGNLNCNWEILAGQPHLLERSDAALTASLINESLKVQDKAGNA